MLRFTTLLLVLSGATLATDQETFRLSFAQKGLDWLETVVDTMDDIIKDVIMAGLVIDPMDLNGVAVTNLKMRDMDLPKPELSIVQWSGYRLNSELTMVIDGDWSFGFFSGDLTVTTKVNLDAVAAIDADMENGIFRTGAESCEVDFESLEIDMKNSLLNIIAKGMVEDVKEKIAAIVCKEVNTALDVGINDLLQAIPHEVKLHLITRDIVFGFGPDSNPIYSADHVDVPCRVQAKSNIPFPFATHRITDSMDPEFIGCVLLSDHLVNSVSFLALSKGSIKENIPNKKFPIGSDLTNTAYFKKSLPQLYKAYPNKDVVYEITNLRFPKLEFNDNLQKVDVPLQVLVKIGGLTVINLNLGLKTRGHLNIAGNVITGTCDEIETTTVVVSSTIGDIDGGLANDIMDDLFLKTIIPDVNAFFEKGFKLPCVEKVIKTRTAIAQTKDDFLRVCGDFELTDYSLAVVRREVEKIVAKFSIDY